MTEPTTAPGASDGGTTTTTDAGPGDGGAEAGATVTAGSELPAVLPGAGSAAQARTDDTSRATPPAAKPSAPPAAPPAPPTTGQDPAAGKDDGQAEGKDDKPIRGAAQTSALSRKPLDEFPPEVRDYVGQLRKEAGDNRVGRKDAETKAQTAEERLNGFLEGFAKVMGLAPETEGQAAEQLTPEQLTAQLGEERSAHRNTQVEFAAMRAALRPGVGADVDALMDSRSFLDKVHALDPAAADFTTQIQTAIDDVLAANPRFRAVGQAPPPPPSGGEFTGGPGGRPDAESMSIEDHLAEINNAQAVGPK